MKVILSLLLVAVAATLVVANDDWEAYKARFNKHYTTEEEDQFRQKLFLQRKQEVEEHNAKYERGEVTYTKALNRFSDWTAEELQKLHGLKPHENQH